MRPLARFALPDGRIVSLGPGDVIGRIRSAALHINDPRISELHAYVSLRGSMLRLLALRGRFTAGLRRVDDVALAPGLELQLAPDITVTVVAVDLPPTLLALEIDGLGRVIPPPVASLSASATELTPGVALDADAVLWSDGDVFHLRRKDSAVSETLLAGDQFVVGARLCRVVRVALGEAETHTTAGGLGAPLVLVIRYDTVHVRRGGEAVAIDGVPARILSELGLMNVPVEWRTIAHELWPAEEDEVALRQKWDAGLARMRRKLRQARLPVDLVRTDGVGRVELMLGPSDRVEDQT